MREQDDQQDKRIEGILGGSYDMDFDKAVAVFFKYLTEHLELPCEVTGIEDFRWEEPYVFGGWDVKEYEQLKKTRPSYTDCFKLLKLQHDSDSPWIMHGNDIAAHVRRISDGKKFVLGLSELKVTDAASSNYQLIDDYAVWFVN